MSEGQFSKIFLIGFNRSGGTWFRDIFKAAGVRWRHDQTGELAADIRYNQLAGTRPLGRWPRLQAVSGLERWRRKHLPPVQAFKDFKYLEEQFPDALFIYNDRDPADWIASRFFAHSGKFRTNEAWHLGVEERDLPELWLKERAAHKTRVLSHFGSNPRFLHFDVSHDPDIKLIDWAAPWVVLADLPSTRGIETADVNLVQIDMLAEHLQEEAKRPRYQPVKPDQDFVDAVVEHCLGTLAGGVVDGHHDGLSQNAAHWNIDGKVSGKGGNDLPLLQGPDGAFYAAKQDQAVDRQQAALSDLAKCGAKHPLWVDMQDARSTGIGDRPAPPDATIVYNRMPGARNLVLWPLAGYHDLAPAGQPGSFAPDDLSFDEKPDTCVWFGNLTGRPLRKFAPHLTHYKMAHQYLRELADGASPERREQITQALNGITRYRVVSRLFANDDTDMGFVLPDKHEKAGQDRLIAPYLRERQPETWVQSGRYVLSLSGNDTGSNFLVAAASNGVVLKEEDGWELFYTAAFRPWEHYIPLSPGANDLEARLEWARSHPAECKEISAAASALVARFAATENRTAWQRALVEAVNARR